MPTSPKWFSLGDRILSGLLSVWWSRKWRTSEASDTANECAAEHIATESGKTHTLPTHISHQALDNVSSRVLRQVHQVQIHPHMLSRACILREAISAGRLCPRTYWREWWFGSAPSKTLAVWASCALKTTKVARQEDIALPSYASAPPHAKATLFMPHPCCGGQTKPWTPLKQALGRVQVDHACLFWGLLSGIRTHNINRNYNIRRHAHNYDGQDDARKREAVPTTWCSRPMARHLAELFLCSPHILWCGTNSSIQYRDRDRSRILEPYIVFASSHEQ